MFINSLRSMTITFMGVDTNLFSLSSAALVIMFVIKGFIFSVSRDEK